MGEGFSRSGELKMKMKPFILLLRNKSPSCLAQRAGDNDQERLEIRSRVQEQTQRQEGVITKNWLPHQVTVQSPLSFLAGAQTKGMGEIHQVHKQLLQTVGDRYFPMKERCTEIHISPFYSLQKGRFMGYRDRQGTRQRERQISSSDKGIG